MASILEVDSTLKNGENKASVKGSLNKTFKSNLHKFRSIEKIDEHKSSNLMKTVHFPSQMSEDGNCYNDKLALYIQSNPRKILAFGIFNSMLLILAAVLYVSAVSSYLDFWQFLVSWLQEQYQECNENITFQPFKVTVEERERIIPPPDSSSLPLENHDDHSHLSSLQRAIIYGFTIVSLAAYAGYEMLNRLNPVLSQMHSKVLQENRISEKINEKERKCIENENALTDPTPHKNQLIAEITENHKLGKEEVNTGSKINKEDEKRKFFRKSFAKQTGVQKTRHVASSLNQNQDEINSKMTLSESLKTSDLKRIARKYGLHSAENVVRNNGMLDIDVEISKRMLQKNLNHGFRRSHTLAENIEKLELKSFIKDNLEI